MTAKDKMQAMIEARSTEQLFDMLDILESEKTVGAHGIRNHPAPEKRMIEAMVADTIEIRHGLEAAMEEIFMDIEYSGTYTDALRQSLARVAK